MLVGLHLARFIFHGVTFKGCVKVFFLVHDILFRVEVFGEVEVIVEGILVFCKGMLAFGPAALVRLYFFFKERLPSNPCGADDLQSLPTSRCGAGQDDR